MSITRSRVLKWMVLVLTTGMLVTAAHADDFFIYNIPGDGTHVNASFGTWKAARDANGAAPLISTGPGTTKPDGATTQIIEFEFVTDNYFSDPLHYGHLGIFVRGDIYTPSPWNASYPYRGHGVVVGNVSTYPWFYHPSVGAQCSPALGSSTVAIEVAGRGNPYYDNCVFGNATSAPTTLSNNTTYKVWLSSRYSAQTGQNTTTYYLWIRSGSFWSLIHSAQISYFYDSQTIVQNGVARGLGGWFISEFGRGIDSSWSVTVRNLVSYWQ